ncbi:MAG: SufS family cysteine desulfurase [Alphaproteobacteria bacterium]|nr:SufS family cysteine desulfurase [Alphaproteobacteria bacterium]
MTINSPWRKDFPILETKVHGDKPLVFLDSAASAQKPQVVIDSMKDVMESGYSNIHRGLYEISQNLSQKFEDTRKKVANFIGAESEKNIVFTRNSTEAINLVAQSWGRTFLKAGDEVLITEMEHHANIVPWQILADQIGIIVKTIPLTEEGTLNLDAFNDLLSEKIKFVGCVEISNALGTINPVQEIISKTRAFNPDIKILIDGSQGAVHRPVNVTNMDCDFYVFTGHKLYGPTGIGVLYGKYEVLQSMPPYQGGGDMIERVSFSGTTYRDAPFKFEAGTPAIVEVIGLGTAIDYLSNIGMYKIQLHEQAILDYAFEAVQKIEGFKLYGPQNTTDRASILSFTMDNMHPSDVSMVLDQLGIALRTGHHCAMPAMEVMGLDATARASFAMYSDQSDVDALVAGLHKVKDMFGS